MDSCSYPTSIKQVERSTGDRGDRIRGDLLLLFGTGACAVDGERRAALGRVDNVVCDGVEVDEACERRGCAQSVCSDGGSTRTAQHTQ